MRIVSLIAAGLLVLACSSSWAIDLPKASDIEGLTKGSLLDKINKNLARVVGMANREESGMLHQVWTPQLILPSLSRAVYRNAGSALKPTDCGLLAFFLINHFTSRALPHCTRPRTPPLRPKSTTRVSSRAPVTGKRRKNGSLRPLNSVLVPCGLPSINT